VEPAAPAASQGTTGSGPEVISVDDDSDNQPDNDSEGGGIHFSDDSHSD